MDKVHTEASPPKISKSVEAIKKLLPVPGAAAFDEIMMELLTMPTSEFEEAKKIITESVAGKKPTAYKFDDFLKEYFPQDNTQEQTVLQEAHSLINGDRRAAYGDPRDSLASVADFWSSYIYHKYKIEIRLDNVDVCQMMALLKMSRELTGETKRDNLVDQAGYLGLAGKIKYEMEDQ